VTYNRPLRFPVAVLGRCPGGSQPEFGADTYQQIRDQILPGLKAELGLLDKLRAHTWPLKRDRRANVSTGPRSPLGSTEAEGGSMRVVFLGPGGSHSPPDDVKGRGVRGVPAWQRWLAALTSSKGRGPLRDPASVDTQRPRTSPYSWRIQAWLPCSGPLCRLGRLSPCVLCQLRGR
jgi:hypothetical protein